MKKGHILLKKAKIDENKKKNTFWIFSGRYGKMSKKVKNDVRDHILMKKEKIDEQWKKITL